MLSSALLIPAIPSCRRYFPPQREMTRRLSAHQKKKPRQRITLPDLTSEPLILTMSINHDKDIELKNKGLAGLYIQPAIKRYYLKKHTSISEECQAHKKVSEAGQFGTIATLALNCHNIWLRKCRLFGVITYCKCHISVTDTSVKLCEGEADLVAQSALAICS